MGQVGGGHAAPLGGARSSTVAWPHHAGLRPGHVHFAWTQFGGRQFSYLFCELLDVQPGRGPGLALPRTLPAPRRNWTSPRQAPGNVKGSELPKGGGYQAHGARPVGRLLGGAQDCTASAARRHPSIPMVSGQAELSRSWVPGKGRSLEASRMGKGGGASRDSSTPPPSLPSGCGWADPALGGKEGPR